MRVKARVRMTVKSESDDEDVDAVKGEDKGERPDEGMGQCDSQ